MRYTLIAIAALICWTGQAEGAIRQSYRGHETQNRYNTGVQTFELADMTDSSSEINQEMATTLKPLPSTYTVVDWQRYYPFGSKLADMNETDSVTTAPNPTKQQPTAAQQLQDNLLYPVYIKVPIRVPLKASYRKPEVGKMIRSRTVRGAKNLGYPYRYKMPPRFMMGVRHHLPIRRKFVSYYPKPSYLYKRHPQYIKPVYLRTGIHDYYQKNVYYPLRGQGYAVTEPKAEWYDPTKVKPSNNLI